MSEKVQHITIAKAADILNKSVHSVRQLLQRGKLKRHKEGSRLFVTLDSVMTYHAVKKGLPAWEDNLRKVSKQVFVSLEFASQTLMVQPVYIVSLIRQKVIEGYVTAFGDVMISRDSINAYLRKPDVRDAAAKDL